LLMLASFFVELQDKQDLHDTEAASERTSACTSFFSANQLLPDNCLCVNPTAALAVCSCHLMIPHLCLHPNQSSRTAASLVHIVECKLAVYLNRCIVQYALD